MIAPLRTLWYRSGVFVRRQKRNFKIMLLRRALHALAVNLTNQYNSIYAVALGADPVQLGSVLSVGNAVAAAVTVPAGWLIDRYSLKKVTMSGTLLLLLSALCYALAPDWRLLFALPIGRLADRYGRKKLLFFIAPVSYLSSALLIGSTGPVMLFLAGLCFGFNSIATALGAAMASEIVPKEQMGRWFGLIGLTRGLVSVPVPLLAGLIWEHAGPRYVFIFAVLLDAAFRLPLLASIRETLDSGFFHKPRGKNAGSAVSAVSPYSPSGHPPGESSGPGWGDSCKMQ